MYRHSKRKIEIKKKKFKALEAVDNFYKKKKRERERERNRDSGERDREIEIYR